MNLVKLHRYLEWKMNAIFQGNTDGNKHLSYIWKKSRFRGRKATNYDGEERNVESSERRGWISGLARRIHSFFRVKKRMSSKSKSESRQLPKWSDLDKGDKVDLLNLLISLMGGETVDGYEMAKKIKAYQIDNDLEKTGTRALISSFGFRNISLPKLIDAEFSEHISAEVSGSGENAAGKRQASNYAYSAIIKSKSDSSSFEDLATSEKSAETDDESKTESSGTMGYEDSKTLEQPHLERAQRKIRAIGEDLSEQLRIKNMEILSIILYLMYFIY